MLTVRGPQRLLMATDDPAFLGHGFFEASSIRKLDGHYVFVYSSVANHELCYATSSRPDGGFAYGGVLVSIGDVGLPGHPDEAHGANYLGNTHGGLLRLGQRTYVFYHRQTNRSSYARQACAEELLPNGRGGWLQAEVTTSGLAGTLPGVGTYQARLACNLWSADGVGRVDGPHPARALGGPPLPHAGGPGRSARQYVANLRDGAVCGLKYLDLAQTRGHQARRPRAGRRRRGGLRRRRLLSPAGNGGRGRCGTHVGRLCRAPGARRLKKRPLPASSRVRPRRPA